MDTPHECEECRQPIVLELGTHPRYFGHVHTKEDWAEFMHDGLCALCAHYLADFAHMNNRKDLAL